jgi:hypothetical protein
MFDLISLRYTAALLLNDLLTRITAKKEQTRLRVGWTVRFIPNERFTRHPRTAALVDGEKRRTDGLSNWVNGQFYWTTIHPTQTTSSTVKFGRRDNDNNLRKLTSTTNWSITNCVNWLSFNWLGYETLPSEIVYWPSGPFKSQFPSEKFY